MRENDLLDRTFSFAVRTLKFHKLARIITKSDQEPFVIPGYRHRLQLKISEAK